MPLYDIDSYLIEEISYKEMLKLIMSQKSSTNKSNKNTAEDKQQNRIKLQAQKVASCAKAQPVNWTRYNYCY